MTLAAFMLARALAGRPPSGPVRRMMDRSEAEAASRQTPGYAQGKRRLAALDGHDCPLCRRLTGSSNGVEFIGTTLICPVGHGWSNPDAAEAEILRGEL